jgi:hypothetical protein
MRVPAVPGTTWRPHLAVPSWGRPRSSVEKSSGFLNRVSQVRFLPGAQTTADVPLCRYATCGYGQHNARAADNVRGAKDDLELLGDSFTIATYIESVDRLIAWARATGIRSVRGVSRHHIRAWLEELLYTVSAQTAVRHHSGAKQWFKWLVVEGEVSSNRSTASRSRLCPRA